MLLFDFLITLYMTFFCDTNLSIVEPHRPHHSNIASGLAIWEEFDTETAALIVKLALDDLADILPADCLPLDEETVHKLQVKEYNEWFSIAEDAKLAKSIDEALDTDAAYLDAFITAEDAAKEDRITAELLSRGEALPVPKSCQTRLEDPAFAMDPVMDAASSDHAGLDIVENGLFEATDNEWMYGGSVGSGDYLMQNRVN